MYEFLLYCGWSQDIFCQYNMISIMKENSDVKG